MVPCHAETWFPGGTGHYYIEGSRDTLIDVYIHALCCIGGLWMVKPIYASTLGIDLNIISSNQSGYQQGKLCGSVNILLRTVSADDIVGNQRGSVVEYG